MKKSLYAVAWMSLVALNSANAAINPGVGNVDWWIQGSGNTADVVIQTWTTRLLMFLALAAVLYGLWGGFNILTAGWDDNKVKTGKTVLINAWIWLVVIFLVYSVVTWLINILVNA